MYFCDSTQKIERFEEEKRFLRKDFMEEDNEHSKRTKDNPRNDKNKEKSSSHGDLLDKEVCFVPHRCFLFLFYLWMNLLWHVWLVCIWISILLGFSLYLISIVHKYIHVQSHASSLDFQWLWVVILNQVKEFVYILSVLLWYVC